KPALLDIFDDSVVRQTLHNVRPDVIIHQLTDLPRKFDQDQIAAAYQRNSLIRTEGTRNLITAATAASARRLIVQSIAFVYAAGAEPHEESDPLNLTDGPRAVTARGAAAMEDQVLNAAGMTGI